MRYTTMDGKPLAWPQPGVTVVHAGSVSWLLLLDCVFVPPPPPPIGVE